jgi:hypothetical protein
MVWATGDPEQLGVSPKPICEARNVNSDNSLVVPVNEKVNYGNVFQTLISKQ